jgi:DNA-directed RNA polymerase specialized sigma24 family protein
MKSTKPAKTEPEKCPNFSQMTDNQIADYILTYISMVARRNIKYKKIPVRERQDFKQDLFGLLYEKRSKYDPKKGTFNTFAYNWIKKLTTKKAISNRNYFNKKKIKEEYFTDYSGLYIDDMKDFMGSFLSLTHKQIFEMRFLQEISSRDIARIIPMNLKKVELYIEEIKKTVKKQYGL